MTESLILHVNWTNSVCPTQFNQTAREQRKYVLNCLQGIMRGGGKVLIRAVSSVTCTRWKIDLNPWQGNGCPDRWYSLVFSISVPKCWHGTLKHDTVTILTFINFLTCVSVLDCHSAPHNLFSWKKKNRKGQRKKERKRNIKIRRHRRSLRTFWWFGVAFWLWKSETVRLPSVTSSTT